MQKISTLAFMTVVAAVSGCARPKYVDSAIQARSQNTSTLGSSECAAQFALSRLCISFAWVGAVPVPNRDFGQLELKIWRRNLLDGSPLPVDPNGPISFQLWMPSMDHPSDPVVLERVDIGSYRVSEVWFNMGGKWEFRIRVNEGQASEDLAIVRGIDFAE